ncbi:hypothetical protein [Sphingomonas sp. RS2018]
MKARILLAATVIIAVTPAAAQRSRELGAETVIDNATGGIRNVQAEGDGSIVYVQDRTLRWYRLTLTGPCFDDSSAALIVVQSGSGNRIDRFTRVASARTPTRVCGVTSIVNALPPKGQPGAKKAD